MFGKPKGKLSHSASGSMKKKAPPRPPPPTKSTIIARSVSTSFDPWNEKKSKTPQVERNQTVSCSYNITTRSDLIDLSSPNNSPPKLSILAENYPGATSNEVPDYKYNIGASIFYIKSELKSSSTVTPPANPFSPPRPNAQTLLTKPKPNNTSVKPSKQPTIIKANAQPTEILNNNNYGTSSQIKYPTVPLEWDEPPKKSYIPPPTVIRPIPPPKPGLSSVRFTERNSLVGDPPPFIPPPANNTLLPRYDEPPEVSDDEFDDSFDSNPVPEPAEPPPPPPEGLDFYDDYGDQPVYSSIQEHNYYTSDSGRAYGIALYDYISSEQGDLQFSVGDVIYLMRMVDDSWLYGACGSSEGMFPTNFINIVVPLGEGSQGGTYPESNSSNEIQAAVSSNDISTEFNSYPTHYVTCLHSFKATEPNDLSIRDGEIVTVIGQVNEEWLYGEIHGNRGQFPASFLEYIPSNLPIMNPKTQ